MMNSTDPPKYRMMDDANRGLARQVPIFGGCINVLAMVD